jgi:hypothetical protein
VICTCECPKTAEVDSGVASAGVAARGVAETANASPGESWALSRSRAFRVEQRHTAPTRWVLPSGEVNQQPRPCLVSIIAGERPGPRRAFSLPVGATKPSAYAARALRRSTRPEVGSWLEMMNTPCAT